MAEFKEGDIVYHKAMMKRGVISRKGANESGWSIVWNDGKKEVHTEAELLTEEEHKQKYPPPPEQEKPSYVK
jgi:hypothetical protein